MRPRSLLVLALLVLALGAFLWFVERDLPGSEERAERARLLLPGLDPGTVTAVTVETEEERWRLERRVAGETPEGRQQDGEVRDGEGRDGEVRDAGVRDGGVRDGEGRDAVGRDGKPRDGGENGAPPPAESGEDRRDGRAAAGRATPPAEDGASSGGGAAWHLAAPPRLAGSRADRAAVEALLSALAGLVKEREVEDVDPRAVGLAEPRWRVVLETAEGGDGLLELRVGSEIPGSRNVLVEVRGGRREGVFAVDRAFLDDLRRPAGDWRARDLFPATRADVTGLTVRGPADAGAVVLEARPDGGFDLVAPYRDAADPPAVDALLAAFTGLRAEAFVDAAGTPGGPSLEALGLAPPRGSVVVETAAGDPWRVEVGAPAAPEAFSGEGGDVSPWDDSPERGGLYLRVDGRAVVAAAPLLAAVERPAADWSSRQLTARRVYEVERLALESAAETLRLERDGVDWRRVVADGAAGAGGTDEAAGERIPYTAVADLLYALTESRADRTFPGAAVRLPAPDLTFTLAGGVAGAEAGTTAPWEETVSLHPRDPEGFVPVTVSGRDRILVLPPGAAADLRAAVEAVRAAPPLPPGE